MGMNYICLGTMSSGLLMRNTCMCDVHGYAGQLSLMLTNLFVCHPLSRLSVHLFFHSLNTVDSMFNI
jgi:hypothetical protein